MLKCFPFSTEKDIYLECKVKFRVMASDGTIEDFETEAEAYVLFNQKRKIARTARIVGEKIPSCNIHRCYHDEGKPCEIIERYEKS